MNNPEPLTKNKDGHYIFDNRELNGKHKALLFIPNKSFNKIKFDSSPNAWIALMRAQQVLDGYALSCGLKEEINFKLERYTNPSIFFIKSAGLVPISGRLWDIKLYMENGVINIETELPKDKK